MTVAALLVVHGSYFAIIAANIDNRAIEDFAYKPLMIVAFAFLAVVMAVSHIVLAVLAPGDANSNDERDRQIEWRSSSLGGYVLASGVFGVLVLALFEAASFYVANALLLAWVLAELTHQLAKIPLYLRTSG